MDKLKEIVADQVRSDFPVFRAGDHVRVHVRVIEGDKERIQPYEGDVINIRGGGLNKTFTVRKIASGVGVERIFSFNSPKISKVEMLREGKVRRAKLFYLRELSGKAARIKDKRVK
ncbi:MAG: 50S ribosomal protein L19 [Melioribacteraceae bacterium]|jgi:large subunit ribosomal protein L19|nr:50S ribosomal protein L19 [Melioribacteraceae bacterium]